MLSNNGILKAIDAGDIYISPFTLKRLNPNSYNLTLNNKLKIYNGITENNPLDCKKDNPTVDIIIPEEGYILLPNKLYLGHTNEYTATRNYVPMISGRSSVGRLGLNVHATAGFGDNGFRGTWTLELFAIQPIRIYPNMEIAQIYYSTLEGSSDFYYNGKYQGQIETTSSKMYLDITIPREELTECQIN